MKTGKIIVIFWGINCKKGPSIKVIAENFLNIYILK